MDKAYFHPSFPRVIKLALNERDFATCIKIQSKERRRDTVDVEDEADYPLDPLLLVLGVYAFTGRRPPRPTEAKHRETQVQFTA